MKFLANTGFLFPDLPFSGRLDAAASAGFDGVEFHDEVQRHDAAEIADTVARLGLVVGSLNIRVGETAGCASLSGHESTFAEDMTAAHQAAAAVGAWAIHVLAGRGNGADRPTYLANLRRALDLTDRTILIEPICPEAMPDYHLATLDDALAVADAVDPERVRIMFDWYHMAMTLGADVAGKALFSAYSRIGHVQVASVPGRAEPDLAVLAAIAEAGFDRVGFEYRAKRDPADYLAALRRDIAL